MTDPISTSHTDKAAIRSAVKAARAARDAADRAREDQARAHLLVEKILTAEPLVVASYLATGQEPDLAGIIAPLARAGIRILFPVLGKYADGRPRRQPDWAVWEGEDKARMGIWNIAEPTTTPLGAQGLLAADVVLCSALAANREGYRCGMGGGWYDRALAYKREDAPIIACLNASEVYDAIPHDAWDHPVDFLATGEEIITCHRGA